MTLRPIDGNGHMPDSDEPARDLTKTPADEATVLRVILELLDDGWRDVITRIMQTTTAAP